jgi:site-specific recombinase XerD
MTLLAPLLEAFFTDQLQRQRAVSPHTIASYSDAFRLLLQFVERRRRKAPAEFVLEDVDAGTVVDFLDYLEVDRRNSPRTRNARLAAIHSFFQYLARREPAHAGLVQRVLAIPQKRFRRRLVTFLDSLEVAALLAAPDQSTMLGRRDHALLTAAVQTGLRVSELTAIRATDLSLGRGAHVRCCGKGRKDRCTPLTRETVKVLRAWLAETHAVGTDLVFKSLRGSRLSNDAVERLVAKYAHRAARQQPSLGAKRVTPHALRHTTAVHLLQAGVDRSVIALWLGHEQVETTQIYLDVDLTIKERALARVPTRRGARQRFRPRDKLLAFLEAL